MKVSKGALEAIEGFVESSEFKERFGDKSDKVKAVIKALFSLEDSEIIRDVVISGFAAFDMTDAAILAKTLSHDSTRAMIIQNTKMSLLDKIKNGTLVDCDPDALKS